MTVDAPAADEAPLWTPNAERAAATAMVRFAREVRAAGEVDAFGAPESLDYEALWRWSVARPDRFWPHLWRFAGVIADPRRGGAPWDEVVHGLDRMAPPDPIEGPHWFAGARLNFAENLLRRRDEAEAIVAWNEGGRHAALTYAELYEAVCAVRGALVREGVSEGDRVAAFMPNVPEAIVAMLAATSLGAIWSSCSPDFGVNGVLDRFGQIGPRVLFACDGYRYAGKAIDSLPRVREIAAAIPEIERVVVLPYLNPDAKATGVRGGMRWTEWLSLGADWPRGAPPTREFTSHAAPERHHSDAARTEFPPFERFAFDHPLYIMYSSGTTGLPKCMVHGAGGTLLQHLKEHLLHTDVRAGDRIFYFTTCGWMMWNWLVSALAVGATIVLYDGAPMAPSLHPGTARAPKDMASATSMSAVPENVVPENVVPENVVPENVVPEKAPARETGTSAMPNEETASARVHAARPTPDLLWEMAATERITHFGTSAKYLALAEKEGLEPARTHDLGALRAVLSTGSPLAPPSFDYVYRSIKRDVCLSSISGGTDIISCFALGNPAGPVWRGELQARGLGMNVDIFDDDGRPVEGEPGELVCTMPFPSMPVAFWNDPDGAKYRAAYFERYPGVWRHGDWAELTPHGGLVITGRSDATLNPGGVRIGTAEIYRQVEQLPEIVESLVIGQDIGTAAERDVRIVLFVRLRDGVRLDDGLRERIRQLVRTNCSPHHVPRVIVQVADIPRTISGKITELAVRDVIHGRPVKNTDALANPAALELFRDVPELAL